MQNKNCKKIIASIIIKNEKILIAKRGKEDEHFGKWEFPGGKLEQGETEKECLARELFEEFKINATIGEYFCSSFFQKNEQNYEMKMYFVNSYEGEITLTEHLEVKLVSKNDLKNYEMPDPDIPVAEKLVKLFGKAIRSNI